MTAFLSAALNYASRGWRVHPLTGKKAVLQGWPSLGTTDTATITGWWTQYPAANVGIITGRQSNLFVLDVDPGKGGDDSLRELEAQYGPLPNTVEVLTGKGGRHFYFQYPGGVVGNSNSKLDPGLDIKTDGGYVVAPSSIHPETQRTYEWEAAHHPDDMPLAPVPQWMLDALTARPAPTLAPHADAPILDGHRNDALTRHAGRMRHIGLRETEMLAALHAINQGRCSPPLDADEVRRVAASVARYAAGEPDDSPPVVDLLEAVVSYTDLLALDLPERPRYLPWLLERSTVMVYGPRGIGKTFFQLALSVALTTGTSLWKWDCPKPVGVLYVDGEMQLDELRQRTTALMVTPPTAPLVFLTGQLVYERCGGKDLILTADAMRQEVVKILDAHPDLHVLILDNISCLFSGLNEDSKQDWEQVNAWLIRLRHRGITTILVHHAGKGGQQRGTSGREDSLDTTIELARPTGGDAREGCHFELTFKKNRTITGDPVASLDVRLETVNGQIQWVWTPLEKSQLDRARQEVADGVEGPTALGEVLGVTTGYASKLLAKLKKEKAV